jgi:hypothetical protein
MILFLLKRDHHEGQTIYGVFETEELALKQIPKLKETLPNVPIIDYKIVGLTLNDLTEIEAYDE